MVDHGGGGGGGGGSQQFHTNLIGGVQVSIDHNSRLYTSSHGIAKHCHVISCDENALYASGTQNFLLVNE